MPLTRVTLTDFRSYARAEIAPGPGFVVLTGENGAGKTNVLEAISLLAPGRGLRGAALGEMARSDGSGGFSMSVMLSNGGALGTGAIAAAPERRIVRINGATASATALSEWLSLVWLTPAQDRLFAGTPGERRRFLDRLVLALEPGHAHHSARYEAAMRQRNRLLAEANPDADWLTALETAMAEHATPIAEARARLVDALSLTAAEQPDGPFARAGLSLEGWDGIMDLGRDRARDAAAGRTLSGPHRQDLTVIHLGKEQPAARSSTGEQKALLLGLVLAHADLVARRIGRRPILLLDEVAAHLDPLRRGALFERLAAGGGQVWMTGTEPALFTDAARADHLAVAGGAIRAL
ncbi:MAG: DNA replication/repair protein RecF [Sphingomonadaceae bacterium]|nr:DNA replication/repair protein RecF [Sphingomonadaceae bacterium]